MSDAAAATGGCFCRAVRFAAATPPIAARLCWCRLCQYLGGGTGLANAGFQREGFIISGEVRWHDDIADSGNRLSRGFCPTCGTPLFSVAEPRPHLIFVRLGALDDPELIAPSATIWTSAAPSWAPIDGRLPRIERQPPPVA